MLNILKIDHIFENRKKWKNRKFWKNQTFSKNIKFWKCLLFLIKILKNIFRNYFLHHVGNTIMALKTLDSGLVRILDLLVVFDTQHHDGVMYTMSCKYTLNSIKSSIFHSERSKSSIFDVFCWFSLILEDFAKDLGGFERCDQFRNTFSHSKCV